MSTQSPYGEEFLQHLTALSRQTPFNYHDLQQVKVMDRDALAERLKKECPGIADYVRSHSAKETAEIVHARRMEVARAISGTSAQGATCSILELVTQLFSVLN